MTRRAFLAMPAAGLFPQASPPRPRVVFRGLVEATDSEAEGEVRYFAIREEGYEPFTIMGRRSPRAHPVLEFLATYRNYAVGGWIVAS